jgi:hypothetical protein
MRRGLVVALELGRRLKEGMWWMEMRREDKGVSVVLEMGDMVKIWRA